MNAEPMRTEPCVVTDLLENELCLSMVSSPGGRPFDDLDRTLRAHAARLTSLTVFAGAAHGNEILQECRARRWPVMVLHHSDAEADPSVSFQATAVAHSPLEPIVLNNQVVGYSWESAHACYGRLWGMTAQNHQQNRVDQAQAMFEAMASALETAGFEFRDTVRTWLYLDHLLDWYKVFNDVRTAFFHQAGVFDRLVPASTGIGAANQFGAALAGGLLAIRPHDKQVRIEAVESPLQCSARSYKSSFSRAIEVTEPGRRYLSISGTASIDPDGQSLHRDDVHAQMDRTMIVVKALLASRNLDWSNTTRSIAYFKHAADLPLFDEYCRRQGLPDLFAVSAHVDVCRPELLFEIEVDARQSLPSANVGTADFADGRG